MFVVNRLARLGGHAAVLAVATTCGVLAGGVLASMGAVDTDVKIDNFTFSPDILTVKRGTKVVFQNHDDIPHSVVDAAGKFRSAALDTDDSFSVTFDTAGEFAYFCGLHPFMKGKIVVAP